MTTIHMFLGRLLRGHAREPPSGIIALMDDKPLLPGQWIDDLPDPLATKEDVEELFRMVHEKMTARIIKKIRTGTYYSDDLTRQ
jgi:hypothetical protein